MFWLLENWLLENLNTNPKKLENEIIFKLFVILFKRSGAMIKNLIINLTKKRVIMKKSALIDTAFSKFIGLMFSKKQDRALIFKFSKEKIVSLHMFFVFYPIDVLSLDKNKIVVDKKESFRPFTFYKSRKKAMYAVELPDGAIKKTKTEIGDVLDF